MARSNPQKDKKLHMAAEAFAVFVISPALWHIANRPGLAPAQQAFLKGVAVGTVLLDGYLLYGWFKE